MALQLNFNQMYFFYMVAVHEGVRNAAKVLHVSPPAVSAQVKRFEESVGVALLTRVRGKLQLTEHGQRIFPEVERIFSQAEQLEKHIHFLQEEHKNECRLGGHYMHMQCIIPKLMPYLSSVKEQYSIQFSVNSQRYIEEQLQHKELNMAVLEYATPNKDMLFQPLLRCKVVLLACKDNPLGQEGAISLHELEQMPVLLPLPDSGFSVLLQDFFAQHNFVPKQSEVFSMPICRRFIPQSSYVAFFPEYFLDQEIQDGQFKSIPLQEDMPELFVSLAYHKDYEQSPSVQHVLSSLPSEKERTELLKGSSPLLP